MSFGVLGAGLPRGHPPLPGPSWPDPFCGETRCPWSLRNATRLVGMAQGRSRGRRPRWQVEAWLTASEETSRWGRAGLAQVERGVPCPPWGGSTRALVYSNAGVRARTPHWGEGQCWKILIPFLLSFTFVFNLGVQGRGPAWEHLTSFPTASVVPSTPHHYLAAERTELTFLDCVSHSTLSGKWAERNQALSRGLKRKHHIVPAHLTPSFDGSPELRLKKTPGLTLTEGHGRARPVALHVLK